jgi:hypothetical protein
LSSAGAIVSVIATCVFFILLFHAFYTSKPARTSGYVTEKILIIPGNVLKRAGIDISKLLEKRPFIFSLLGSDTLLGLPLPDQINFQLPATPIIEGLIDLHHDILFFLVFIIVFVLYLLAIIVLFFHESKGSVRNTSTVSHHTYLEIIWTIIPTIILIFIAVPSFALLYSIDDLMAPVVTLKVIGRQ